MKNTNEGKKTSAEHQKELKKGKKGTKYGKKRNIPLKEFKGIKNTKRYKAEVEKIVSRATKEKAEVNEKKSTIASLLRSEVEKQVKFTTGKLPGNPTVSLSDTKFESVLGSIFKSKDKSK